MCFVHVRNFQPEAAAHDGECALGNGLMESQDTGLSY